MGILKTDQVQWQLRAIKLPVFMWHRLKNLSSSLNTYQMLSPDLKVRQQVSKRLAHRPVLGPDDWFNTFYKPLGVAYAIAAFAYAFFAKYSGLEFSQVLPSDRLDEDLHWAEICWFDWELQLCDDFQQQFGVDVSDCLNTLRLSTIGEWVIFLDQLARTRLSEPLHRADLRYGPLYQDEG